MVKTNYVTIRGTKEGLILILDDECSFSELVSELQEKLSSNYPQISEGPAVNVKVSVGHRYLSDEHKQKLTSIISGQQSFVITQFESNVITKEEAELIRKEAQTTTLVRVVRSGQVLTFTGNLLLIGDVNPGGTIVATGNIYILGVLRGIAHAGSDGDTEAIIAASKMEPSQLRIADSVSRAPDTKDEEIHEMEFAYIGADQQISIEKIQHLGKLRPGITNITL